MSDALLFTVVSHVLLVMILGLRVVYLRIKHKVGIGEGGNRELKRAIRVHANFVEWVPFALIAIASAELRGADERWIWGLGGVLLFTRIGHALGLSRSIGPSIGRTGGMTLMFLVMLVALGLAVVGG